jgi:16S rRNA (guanine527-N7)-methyltransferase
MTGALAQGIEALQLDVDLAARRKLASYLTILDKWNRTHNLTAIREPARMITHHLLDCLAVLPHLPRRLPLRIVDVGSGGGLPGIPLAIARPAWHVALVDSNHKKVAFLNQAAIELPLANVDVVAERVEEYAPGARFDVVIARAFADLPTFAIRARHLLAVGGHLVAMKGNHPGEESEKLPPGIRIVAAPRLDVPGVDGKRHLVIMQDVES